MRGVHGIVEVPGGVYPGYGYDEGEGVEDYGHPA